MEQEKVHKSKVGAIVPEIVTRIQWGSRKSSLSYFFILLICRENRRLYELNLGRKEGKFGPIPEGWFDYEIKDIQQDMSCKERSVSDLICEIGKTGLVEIRLKNQGRSAADGTQPLKKNIFKINWDLLDLLSEKYKEGYIDIETIKMEDREMKVSNLQSCSYVPTEQVRSKGEKLGANEVVATSGSIEDFAEECLEEMGYEVQNKPIEPLKNEECTTTPPEVKEAEIAPVPEPVEVCRGPVPCVEYRSAGPDREFQKILARIPEYLTDGILSKTSPQDITRVVRSMRDEGSGMNIDQWKETYLPRLGTSLGFMQINQLWNIFR